MGDGQRAVLVEAGGSVAAYHGSGVDGLGRRFENDIGLFHRCFILLGGGFLDNRLGGGGWGRFRRLAVLGFTAGSGGSGGGSVGGGILI